MMQRRALTGYGVLTHPEGSIRERDTFTCPHCCTVRHVQPLGRGFLVPLQDGTFREHEFVRCGQCDTLICEECAREGWCIPFEEKLKRYEAQAALYARIKSGG